MAVARDSVGSAAAPVLARVKGLDVQAKIEFVNGWVNRNVQFVDDRVQYGKADFWSKASSTIVRKKGDCEDIAILKLKLLEAAGVPSSSLYLSIVRDLVRRADHAVLVAVTPTGAVVLDNGGNALIDASRPSDYRPMFTLSAKGRWTHGYARS